MGDTITGVELGSIAAGGGLLVQGGKALVVKGSATAARKAATRQAAMEAAGRLGIKLSEITISKGVANATIGFTKTIRGKDIETIIGYMRRQGASRGRINTGLLGNDSLKAVLDRAVGRGPQTYLGGGIVSKSPKSKLGDFIIDIEF